MLQNYYRHNATFPLADDGEMDPINDLEKALNGENFILLKEGEALKID